MRKRFCSFLLLCAMTLATWSQEMAHVLIVELTDGTSAKFALADKPVISHSGNDVVIKSELLSTTYSIDAVKKYRFEVLDITDIEDVEEMQQLSVVYTDGETLRIGGVKDAAKVDVFSLDARNVATDKYFADGQVVVSLANLPSGVYIVSVNGKQSFKVVRK